MKVPEILEEGDGYIIARCNTKKKSDKKCEKCAIYKKSLAHHKVLHCVSAFVKITEETFNELRRKYG